MEALKFSIVLQELPVLLSDKNGTERKYYLRELTGSQRAAYNRNFDIKIEMEDGKAKASAGSNFKITAPNEFLYLCLYDDSNKLVDSKFIDDLPTSVTEALHKEALILSGMDDKAEDAAKNE